MTSGAAFVLGSAREGSEIFSFPLEMGDQSRLSLCDCGCGFVSDSVGERGGVFSFAGGGDGVFSFVLSARYNCRLFLYVRNGGIGNCVNEHSDAVDDSIEAEANVCHRLQR